MNNINTQDDDGYELVAVAAMVMCDVAEAERTTRAWFFWPLSRKERTSISAPVILSLTVLSTESGNGSNTSAPLCLCGVRVRVCVYACVRVCMRHESGA